MEQDVPITPTELQAELDTLRSIRRRSLSQSFESHDPDLPQTSISHNNLSPPVPQSSPQYEPTASVPSLSPPVSSSYNADSANPDFDHPLSDLFWLPAHLHPEIAPQEFRNFIREHTNPESLMRRTGNLGRKRSTLSRQYHPTEQDGVGDETASETDGASVSARPSVRRGHPAALDRLTLSDLQRLETLVNNVIDQSSGSEGGDGQTKVLVRRSLSLNPVNLVGAAAGQAAEESSPTDQADSPLLSNTPASIQRQRRSATKVRKSSLLSEGGTTRYPSSRRVKLVQSQSIDEMGHARQTSLGSLGSSEGGLDASEQSGSPSASPTAQRHSLQEPSAPRLEIQHVRAASSDGVLDSYAEARQGKQAISASDSKVFDELYNFGSSIGDGRLTTSPTALSARPENISTPSPTIQTSPETPSVIAPKSLSPSSLPPESRLAIPSASPTSTQPPKRAPSPGTGPKEHELKRPLHIDIPADAMSGTRPTTASATPISPDVSSLYEPIKPQPAVHPHYPSVPPIAISSPDVDDIQSTSPPRDRTTREKKSSWGARLGLSKSRETDDGDADDSSSLSSGNTGQSSKKAKKEKKSKSGEAGIESKKLSKEKDSKGDKEREKEPKFFSAIFGGGKKKSEAEQAEPYKPPPQAVISPTASGMLGAGGRYMNFYRLPIHVERAVYRLSHIKLANPRRPLYEQVLISNLMFWYLSIINKPPNNHVASQDVRASATTSPAGSHGPSPSGPSPTEWVGGSAGEPSRGNPEIAPAISESPMPTTVPQPSIPNPAPSHQPQVNSSPRKGLTKSPSGDQRRSPTRSAEMPVRPPQFDRQHQLLDQEYAKPQRATNPHSIAQPARPSPTVVTTVGGGQSSPQDVSQQNAHDVASGPSPSRKDSTELSVIRENTQSGAANRSRIDSGFEVMHRPQWHVSSAVLKASKTLASQTSESRPNMGLDAAEHAWLAGKNGLPEHTHSTTSQDSIEPTTKKRSSSTEVDTVAIFASFASSPDRSETDDVLFPAGPPSPSRLSASDVTKASPSSPGGRPITPERRRADALPANRRTSMTNKSDIVERSPSATSPQRTLDSEMASSGRSAGSPPRTETNSRSKSPRPEPNGHLVLAAVAAGRE